VFAVQQLMPAVRNVHTLKSSHENKMSIPFCPSGYEFLQSTCLSNCAAGTVVATSNPFVCVSTLSCPVGTNPDGSGLSCVKVAPTGVQTATGGVCPEGYTLWSSNTCYINCPVGFYENGTECARVVFPRDTEDPSCSALFTSLKNDRCVVNGWPIFLFLALFALLILLIVLIVHMAKSPKVRQTRVYMPPRRI